MKDEAEQKAELIFDEIRLGELIRIKTYVVQIIADGLKAERKGEFVRGLERAKEIIRLCRTTEHYALLEESGVLDVSNAIQAEIDKAKAGK